MLTFLPLLSIYICISLSNCLCFYHSFFSFHFSLPLACPLHRSVTCKVPLRLIALFPFLSLSASHRKTWTASIEFLSFHLWTELNSDYSWEPPHWAVRGQSNNLTVRSEQSTKLSDNKKRRENNNNSRVTIKYFSKAFWM